MKSNTRKIVLLFLLFVSELSAKDLSSYYIGIGKSDSNLVSDITFNGGFNISIINGSNFNLELETLLSISNNDNNFLDLLPQVSYKSQVGTFSILGGLTVGYFIKQDVVGSSVGGKYTTPFQNHKLQLAYKKTSVESSIIKFNHIDRYSVNYVYLF
jgi:hypothetical protein